MAKSLFEDEQNDFYMDLMDPSKTTVLYIEYPCGHKAWTEVRSCDISEELMKIYDLSGAEYGYAHFEGANISIPVCCNICDIEFQEIVYVTGYPQWNEEEINDERVPKIEYFVGCEVICLSAKKDTSLRQCFLCENMYSEEVHLIPNSNETMIAKFKIDLMIVAKTKMNNGFCFLGIDISKQRILRPIHTTAYECCCWSTDQILLLKSRYTFVVIHHPDDASSHLTPYPHCLEDTTVLPNPELQQTDGNVGPIRSIAKDYVTQVFSDIKYDRYVEEHTQSNSAGIIKCRTKNMQILPQAHRSDRCILKLKSGTYNFPITATEYDDIRNIDKNAYVVLGLSRPFLAYGKKPLRCYIIVVGIHVLDI